MGMSAINPVAYEEISIKLIRKYVDDILAGLYKFKLGTRWDPKQQLMVWSPKAQQEDTRNRPSQRLQDASTRHSHVDLQGAEAYGRPQAHNHHKQGQVRPPENSHHAHIL